MRAITIRPRLPEDDARIVDIGNQIAPEFPQETVEDLRHHIATVPESVRQEHYVAEQDSRVVGDSLLLGMFWAKQPDRYIVHVAVDVACWRQGIGSQLHDQLIERARELGATHLYGEFLERLSEAERFLSRRGFDRTGRVQRMSRLDVHRANLAGYEGIEERVQAEGLRIATLAEAGPDDEGLFRALHQLDETTSRDIPTSEEIGSFPYEVWRRDLLEAPGKSPEWLWLALDGKKPVGMATLKREGERAAWNAYTGVDRAYRGRGVARALKLRTIQWARQNGVDFIYTGNDIANQRMLAINIQLGYEPLPGWVEVVKELA